MNKVVATAAIVGATVLSPIASMAISPTREALLNLAPDEAILKVADELDVTKNTMKTTEDKISEMQKTIADQQAVIDGQKADLESARVEIDGAKVKQSAVETQVSALQKKADETYTGIDRTKLTDAEKERLKKSEDEQKIADKERERKRKEIVDKIHADLQKFTPTE